MTIDMSKHYMNDHDKQPDSLDALFRAARNTEAYLADDGFSDRVMTSLPTTSGHNLTSWKKNTLIIGSAALGSATAAMLTPAINLPVGEILASFSSFSIGAGLLLSVTAGLFCLSGLALWVNHKELI